MKIGIIGSGGWGTALALTAFRNGNNQVTIWSRSKEQCDNINKTRQNIAYLPNIIIPQEIKITHDFSEIIDNDLLLLTVPAQEIRNICIKLKSTGLAERSTLLICSKGIELGDSKLLSDVCNEILTGNEAAALSGPNFAGEIAQNLPAITSIAASDLSLAKNLQKHLNHLNFRIYPNDDLIGSQIFGAAKNVLAIAAGICMGRDLGENAKASIISRGIHEINNLSIAMGGKAETALSPAGTGDIFLTCNSLTSRNTSFGINLAKGLPPTRTLVEGSFTAKAMHFLRVNHAVELPICEAVYKIAHLNKSVDSVIEELLNR